MYQILVGIQYISIFLLLLEAAYVFSKMRTRLHYYLLFNCVATLVNNTGYLMEMLAESKMEYLRGLQMSYLGRVWTPLSLFVFTLILCKVKIKRGILSILACLHVFIFLLVLTCQHHTLYYSSMTYVKEGLFPHIECSSGVWHVIYSVLLIAYIIYGIICLIRSICEEKNPVGKRRMVYVALTIFVESACFIINLLGLTGCYDFTVMGYTIGTLFMYVAIFRYGMLDTLQLAKEYVVDEVSEAILAVNDRNEIEYYNKPARHIFGEIEQDAPNIVAMLQKSVDAGEPIEIREKIYSPSVEKLYQNDYLQGKVYVLVDDTAHYNYMKELKEQKEIAEAANASKSAFLSVVTHEIRTPMNSVVGMTEIILRDADNLTDTQEKYLRNIKNSGDYLVMMVNDILDKSKIEAGKMEIINAPYELRPLAEDVKMIIENRIGAKPIELIYEIADEVSQYLVGDALRIRQILINLMNNAVKFTDEGYIKLNITCVVSEETRQMLRFSIEDSGQGIKPEDLKKLGQAFTQVDTKKNHSKEGTGLGLSISRDFIEMMGGKLEVTSEYGKGTKFFFSIWQDISKEIEEETTNKDTEENKSEDFTAREAKILIVDDMELNLMIATELLKPMEMQIETATSGERALEMVQERKYDLVFVDYMMPYMDGVEMTERFRALASKYDDNADMAEYFKLVPIIALSGDGSDETKEKFLKAGINDFTDKPVELRKLKDALLKWLPQDLIQFVE